MSTEQARKEIVEETLSNRDELRRALIEGLEKDVGDGFLNALILLIRRKNEVWSVRQVASSLVVQSLEDMAIEYANSVNIEE